MAFSLVQSTKANYATVTELDITYSSNVTQGNLLVLYGQVNLVSNGQSVHDTQGNLWREVCNILGTGSNDFLYYAIAVATGTNTVKVSTPSALTGACIAEYTGFVGAPTVDQFSSAKNTVSAGVTASITTLFANEILVTGISCGGGWSSTAAPFTSRQTIIAGGIPFNDYADRIVSSIGTYSASFTTAGAGGDASVIASFYDAGPGISSLTYTVTDSTIVATWNTSVLSDSNLFAGTQAAIDNGVAANSYSHQCIVTGLAPNTTYLCYVSSSGVTSTPSSITTSAAQTRIPITTIAFGTPVTGSVHGDSLNTFVLSDGIEYGFMDDCYGAPYNSNMALVKVTNDSTVALTQVNALSAYGVEAATNGTDGPGGVPMSNKLSGIFGMNGSLYLFQTRTPYDTPQSQWFANIMRSTNSGATWNSWQAPSIFNANGIPPSPLGSYQYGDPAFGWNVPVRYAIDDGTLGYTTAGNQIDGANGYVYIICSTLWDNATSIYLQRVPRIQFEAQSTAFFQWWTGPTYPKPSDFVNNSNWATAETNKTAIYSVASQCGAPDMVFVPPLNSYLLLTWYQIAAVTSNTKWVVLAGPTPAGPWTTIGTQINNPAGWYNPTVIHRTLASNVLTNNIPLTLAFSGDYFNQTVYYYVSRSTATLGTGGMAGPGVSNFVTGGGSAVVASFSSATFSSTTGDLIVVAVRVGGNPASVNVSTVKNAAGQSFTKITATAYTQGTSQFGAMYYLENAIGNASDVITVTLGGSPGTGSYNSIAVWDIAGALSSGTLDQATVQTTGTLGVFTSPSFTTTRANQIILAALITDQINDSFTQQSGYNLDSAGYPVGGGLVYCGAEHKIVSAIQTGVTTAMTATTAPTNGALVVATFNLLSSLSGNAGVPGAIVSYVGGSFSAVTADGSGNYIFPSLSDGACTITPHLTNYAFTSASSSQTVSGANITGVNFSVRNAPGGIVLG